MTDARAMLIEHNEDLGYIHDRCQGIRPNEETANALLVAHLVRETLNGLSRCINKEQYKGNNELLEELGHHWNALAQEVLKPLLADDKLWSARSERKALEDGMASITRTVEILLKQRDSNREKVAKALSRHLGKRIDGTHRYVKDWLALTAKSTGIAHFQGPGGGIPEIAKGQRLAAQLDELLDEIAVAPSEAIQAVDELLEELNDN